MFIDNYPYTESLILDFTTSSILHLAISASFPELRVSDNVTYRYIFRQLDRRSDYMSRYARLILYLVLTLYRKE